jgi:DNA-damage-inducible protein J
MRYNVSQIEKNPEISMAATAMVHARVEKAVKERAANALASMGLTVSGAVNMFLTRVAAEGAIPFEVRIPNAATREAMAEADALASTPTPRFSDADTLIDALEAPGQ